MVRLRTRKSATGTGGEAIRSIHYVLAAKTGSDRLMIHGPTGIRGWGRSPAGARLPSRIPDRQADVSKTNRQRERQRLLRDVIEEEVRQTAQFTGRRQLAERVLDALERVPRERFVPEYEADSAYANVPLPIGYRQTISQPYIVALMTDLLDPEPDHVVLEIGTGSGYQAAVLAGLVARVYSVEVIPELAEQAARRLSGLGYDNVIVRAGDGNLGWPEHAPYDGIIVTAGAPAVPPALVEQLKPGAPLVIPVRAQGYGQVLQRITRDVDGRIDVRDVLPVAFVPLVGDTARLKASE
jgi:protein-L-isoaspartate(D-aspartate) O-methyltransferase